MEADEGVLWCAPACYVLIGLSTQVISGHLGWVRCIAVDPSNDWFASGSGDRTIKVLLVVLLCQDLCYWFLTAVGASHWASQTHLDRTH